MPSVSQLTADALSLPLPARVVLAHQLLDSIHDGAEPGPLDEQVRAEIERRDAEMESGAVAGVPHEEAMKMIEKSLRCK